LEFINCLLPSTSFPSVVAKSEPGKGQASQNIGTDATLNESETTSGNAEPTFKNVGESLRRHAPSGNHYALLKRGGKQFRRSLRRTKLTQAIPQPTNKAETKYMIDLLTFLWLFNTSQPALSTLSVQAPQAEFAAPEAPTNGFTVNLTVDLKRFDREKNILEIPQVLSVRLRQHDPFDRERQNYPTFKMPDGSVPVLEATVALHSTEHPDWKEMTLGVPLGLLQKPAGEHEVVLNFSGVRWTLYVDGRLLDNDFPFGYPPWPARNTWKLDAEFVKQAKLFSPALTPTKEPARMPNVAPVQYWTPPGHNSWVGDVVTCFYRGRYHLFYLYDRRHHASKFGKGAHYFEHLSTVDFRTWTEHEAATPLDEQWECIGTGTPFVFSNQLCLAYGLHTGRVYPDEKTTWPAQWEFLKQNGRTGKFEAATTSGVPAGSTYALSTDGVARFKKSRIMFHPCQNPSVYTDPKGQLRLLANAGSKGIWESESPDGGWRCVSPDFPPGGDCTFFFRWGKFDYIIGGFTGLWSKPAVAPDSAYEDVVRKGLDFYDGCNVPAITEIGGGRFVMAAWIPIGGWGGPLVLRELIQSPEGRIGSKWMEEVMPRTGSEKTLAPVVVDTQTFQPPHKSFLLTFEVQPAQRNKGTVGVSFLPEQGERAGCELQVGLETQRTQFAPAPLGHFAAQEKSLREGGAPQQVSNYTIEHLIGVDGPFAVRVIVKGDDKLGGSLIDAEVAGQRTMISYRPDLTVKRLLFRPKGVNIENVQIRPLLSQ
jgi:hypothetical protein